MRKFWGQKTIYIDIVVSVVKYLFHLFRKQTYINHIFYGTIYI